LNILSVLPTVSGTTITVDTMLNQPTRITRYLSDLTLRGYWADQGVHPGGGVSGGAILYTQLTQNDLFVSARGMCRTLSRVLSSRW
jgi:hypothetical protein